MGGCIGYPYVFADAAGWTDERRAGAFADRTGTRNTSRKGRLVHLLRGVPVRCSVREKNAVKKRLRINTW